MSLAALITIAALAIKHGDKAYQLANKYGPLALEAAKALAPIVTKAIEQHSVPKDDGLGQVAGVVRQITGQRLTMQDRRAAEGLISEAEQRWMDHASRVSDRG